MNTMISLLHCNYSLHVHTYISTVQLAQGRQQCGLTKHNDCPTRTASAQDLLSLLALDEIKID